MELTTRIEEVTVYADRALITRVGKLRIEAGTHQVRITGLPVALVQDSVRVSGSSTGRAVLHGFDYKTVYTGGPSTERVAHLEQMAVALGDRERTINDAHAVHATQLTTLRQTAEKASGGLVHQLSEGRAKLSEWEATLAFLEERQKAEAATLLGLEQQLREVASEKARIEAELWTARGMRATASGVVTVTVEAPEAAEVTLSLDYVVPGASWTPAYDARLSTAGDRLEWRYFGMVTQTTGEHWEDVNLRLSTAQPAEGSRPPVVADWFLSAYHPPRPEPVLRRREMAAPGGGGDELEGAFEMASMPPPAPMAAAPKMAMEATVAVVRHEGTSVTLSVAKPLTVPSHGEPHQAPIGQADFPVTQRYTVVPKQALNAFLEVEITHDGPWPLIPGPVKAYVGQDYVGTTPLTEDVLTGARFWLPMGTDRAIQVKRQRLKKSQGEAGMIQKQKTHDYQYEITLTSYKPAPVKVRLVEPVPRGTQDDIKVKLGTLTPAPRQDEPGKLIWDLELKPQEAVNVRWDYRVEYPSSLIVNGLE